MKTKLTFLLTIAFAINSYSFAQVPVADFTASQTVICVYDSVWISFTDLSTNSPDSWNWTFQGAYPSTSNVQNPNTGYFYLANGAYDVTLIVSNASGSDTLTKIGYIKVYESPLANAGNNAFICQGNSIDLTASGGTFYSWSAGQIATTITVTPVITTTYTVTVTDDNGCSDTDDVIVFVLPLPTIKGIITDSGATISNGYVNLYEYAVNSQMLLTDSVIIQSDGHYEFTNVPAAQYVVYAKPEQIDYPDAIGTYYYSEYQWGNATVINAPCGSITDHIDINVVTLISQPYGNDTISGTITSNTGDPLNNVHVILEQTSGGVIDHTYTNILGFYEFLGVAPGSYNILVDIPGLPMDSSYIINISNKIMLSHYDYIVGSTGIYIPATNGIENNSESGFVNIYPNPFNSTTVFEIQGMNQPFEFELYNITGEQVKSISNITDKKFVISRQNLCKGIYIYKISSDNGLISRGKLIVN